MRIGKMKNVWKRIGAFALALVIAVPIIGVGADTIPVTPPPSDPKLPVNAEEVDVLETVVVGALDETGKQIATNTPNADGSYKARLEIGDRVQVAVRAKTEIEGALRIEGVFEYNTDFFDTVKQSDIKSDLLGDRSSSTKGSSAPQERSIKRKPTQPGGDDPADGSKQQWLIGWSQSSSRLTANWYPQTKGNTIKAGENIFIITLRVRKAVDDKIEVQYRAASNGKDTIVNDSGDIEEIDVEDGKHGITIVKDGANQLQVQTTPAKCTMANPMYGKRQFTLSVKGNAEESGKSSLKVSLDPNETVKAEMPISVKNDNGYCGFTIRYTYDSYYLTPDLDNILTGQARSYIQVTEKTAPQTVEAPSKDPTDTDWKAVTITVASSYDIKMIGDLMKLSFNVNKEHEEYLKNHKNETTKIYVDLVDVVTESDPENSKYNNGKGITMNKSIDGTTTVVDYTDKEGNTTSIPRFEMNVSFVEHLVPFGDVDGNGVVNLIDATKILRYYNQEPQSDLTEDELKRADVDQNGTVNLVDAVLIIKYYNSDPTVPSLPHPAS